MKGSGKFISYPVKHKYIANTHVIDKAHEYTQANAIKAVQSVHDG